jgi:hypothetical protein
MTLNSELLLKHHSFALWLTNVRETLKQITEVKKHIFVIH